MLTGRRGPPQLDPAAAVRIGRHELGMLDHHHRVGAARHHAAGRDHGGGARTDRQRRRMPGRQDLGVEAQTPGCVGSAAVSAARTAKPSTLERSKPGTSTGGDHVVGQHAAERLA